MHRKYVWDGWRVLLELEGGVGVPPAEDVIVRKYTWGLDLAGQSGAQSSALAGLEGAGGTLDDPLDRQGQVGGLLAVHDAAAPGAATGGGSGPADYVYLYDANGNVGQVVDWAHTPISDAAGALVARYEYDPYGTVIGPDTDNDGQWLDDAGAYAGTNAWRFSTKQFDNETGLGYWGYRYYSPTMGRWISRDPIEEDGGFLLYAYVSNGPLIGVDPVGQQASCPVRFRWNVDVTGKNVGRGHIATTIRVKSMGAPCCRLVRFVQLVNETQVRKTGPVWWTNTATNAVDSPNWGILPPHTPWYEHSDHNQTPGVVDEWVLTDEPGLKLTDFATISIGQDFETCAICVSGSGMRGTSGCVIGCVRWGHSWIRGKPDIHSWYGNGATPGSPSAAMTAVLGKFSGYWNGFPIGSAMCP